MINSSNSTITNLFNGSTSSTSNLLNTLNTYSGIVSNLYNSSIISDYQTGIGIAYINNWYPESFNDVDGDGSILIELSVPGYKKEDIKISIEKENINFKAEIKESTKWIKSFNKSFYIGSYFDKSKIKAKLESGILQVIIPLKDDYKNSQIIID